MFGETFDRTRLDNLTLGLDRDSGLPHHPASALSDNLANNAGDHLANSASFFMPDNITIDNAGHILIQEDPGGDNYLARIFAYNIASGQLKAIATFDPALFTPARRRMTEAFHRDEAEVVGDEHRPQDDIGQRCPRTVHARRSFERAGRPGR